MDGTTITAPVENQRKLENITLSATNYAAKAVRPLWGCNDGALIDRTGTQGIREALGSSEITATCRSTEGTMDGCDEETMLLQGEILGTNGSSAVDFATDPVEGTSLVAHSGIGGCSVLALGKDGSILELPDTYAEKFVFGLSPDKYFIDPYLPIEEKLVKLAAGLNKYVGDLRVVVLSRPRHERVIASMHSMGVEVTQIQDGDLMPGVLTAIPGKSTIDAVYGIGGGPEGILTAAALAERGTIHARFLIKDDLDNPKDQEKVSVDMEDILQDKDIELGKVYTNKELISGWAIFAATSIQENGLFLPHLRDGVGPYTSVLIASGEGLEPRIIWE